jgi:PP-loop superfamily ATP-utilizing enzyme
MTTFSDRCYFCDNTAEYNDIVKIEEYNYIISGVCKEHLKMGLSA